MMLPNPITALLLLASLAPTALSQDTLAVPGRTTTTSVPASSHVPTHTAPASHNTTATPTSSNTTVTPAITAGNATIVLGNATLTATLVVDPTASATSYLNLPPVATPVRAGPAASNAPLPTGSLPPDLSGDAMGLKGMKTWVGVCFVAAVVAVVL
ncbi:uncharacterized protein EV422DRAFT_533556 [Fimicolochytrium jonesii]|uniref:uncharacterized protein n=1 Tax=Fimicolochytrium jonesii TaxID=1396493 RepID=UPI0022FDF52A|nr:uncharacterized protein EV422DRAFT_533556 [Fimicolochytrium jonesii]KAI8819583.1 hypothetical protein EV422DRAFT_533556 [Fimicolochytrium jonesii]